MGCSIYSVTQNDDTTFSFIYPLLDHVIVTATGC